MKGIQRQKEENKMEVNQHSNGIKRRWKMEEHQSYGTNTITKQILTGK
jgi:hypothetical protein